MALRRISPEGAGRVGGRRLVERPAAAPRRGRHRGRGARPLGRRRPARPLHLRRAGTTLQRARPLAPGPESASRHGHRAAVVQPRRHPPCPSGLRPRRPHLPAGPRCVAPNRGLRHVLERSGCRRVPRPPASDDVDAPALAPRLREELPNLRIVGTTEGGALDVRARRDSRAQRRAVLGRTGRGRAPPRHGHVRHHGSFAALAVVRQQPALLPAAVRFRGWARARRRGPRRGPGQQRFYGLRVPGARTTAKRRVVDSARALVGPAGARGP